MEGAGIRWSDDSKLKLWSLQLPTRAWTQVFSADGKRLLAAGKTHLEIAFAVSDEQRVAARDAGDRAGDFFRMDARGSRR